MKKHKDVAEAFNITWINAKLLVDQETSMKLMGELLIVNLLYYHRHHHQT